MIICINFTSETKAKMDNLLAEFHYSDYGELVSVAIENLLVLNREIGKRGSLVIDNSSTPSSALQNSPNLTHFQSKISYESRTQVSSISNRIPELFLLNGLDKLSVSTVDIPHNDKTEEKYTLDRWLFGQYNKLLPVKANCRALTRLVEGNINGVPLDTVAGQIAIEAINLGDFLSEYDRKHKNIRDEAFATAFPHSGPDVDKSRSRYANLFVGSVNSKKILSGLLWDYRLVSLSEEIKPHLLPTKQAIQFACLENPILDGSQSEPTIKFSKEEIAFLLEHIKSFIPSEAFAFRTLIQAIANGADTPEKLDKEMVSLIPAKSKKSFSPSFLASQRSGALSRMADLGLIVRVRKGVNVSYEISNNSQTFINS